jgi:hypothetical protein
MRECGCASVEKDASVGFQLATGPSAKAQPVLNLTFMRISDPHPS